MKKKNLKKNRGTGSLVSKISLRYEFSVGTPEKLDLEMQKKEGICDNLK